MLSDIKFTVLDQSPVHPAVDHPAVDQTAVDQTAVDMPGYTETVQKASRNAAQATIELAKACDHLGYYRYWVAEHHNSPQFAGPSPEIFIASIASVTKNMRVGSGGVMLTHYSPFKVAEVFNLLNALFPDRIDLGIGRAPGGDQLASSALAWPGQPQNAEAYPAQAVTLKSLLQRTIDDEHPWSKLHITPAPTARSTSTLPATTPTPTPTTRTTLTTSGDCPQLWMLGSSGGSAELAGHIGMKLALARFITADRCSPDIFNAYERAWTAAGHSDAPDRMLAIAAFCADTKEEAEHLASTAIYRKMMVQTGDRESLLPPDEVQRRRASFTTAQEADYKHIAQGYTIGTPDQCLSEIEALAKSYASTEIAVVTVTHDFAARLKSYQLLATG